MSKVEIILNSLHADLKKMQFRLWRNQQTRCIQNLCLFVGFVVNREIRDHKSCERSYPYVKKSFKTTAWQNSNRSSNFGCNWTSFHSKKKLNKKCRRTGSEATHGRARGDQIPDTFLP